MTYDSTELNLTREEALKLHRAMWTEMQEKLGDNPSADDRCDFKGDWCEKHFPNHSIVNDCFLCEYVNPNYASEFYCKERCPIDWESLKKYDWGNSDCCAIYKGYSGKDSDFDNKIYLAAPISEILALPEREVADV